MNISLPRVVRGAARLPLVALLALTTLTRVHVAAAEDQTPPPAAAVAPENTPPPAAPAVEAPAAAPVPAADAPSAPASAAAPAPVQPSEPAPQVEPETPTPTAPAAEPSGRSSPATPTEAFHRGDLVSIGNDADLGADESSNDMVTILGNAIVDGRVRGQSVTVVGNVTLRGAVNGDLVCVLGQVTIGPGAEVRGDVVSVGGRVALDPTAHIRGQKVEIPFFSGIGFHSVAWIGDWVHDGLLWGRMLPHNLQWAWTAAAIFLLINLLFAAIFRRPVDASVSVLERRPVRSVVGGLLTLLLAGPIITLLSISIVGLLVVPFIAAGLFIAWYAGVIAVYRYCAEQLGVRGMPLLAVLAGNILFILLYAVPALGLAVWSVTGLVGLGSAVTAFFEGMRRERETRKRPPRETTLSSTVAMPPSPPSPAPPAVTSAAAEKAAIHESSTEKATPAGAPIATETPPAASETMAPGLVPTPPMPLSHSGAAAPRLPSADTLERAGVWPRLAALAMDSLFLIVAYNLVPLLFLVPHSFALLFLAYHIAFWSWRGTTPGGLVLNLRIERLDGKPMTPGIATARALAGIFSVVPGGLGFWWVGWDEAQQSWHDKIAGTVVVRVSRTESFV